MNLESRQYLVTLDMTRTGSIRESFEMRHNDDNELIIELRDANGLIDLNASGVISTTLLVTRKDKVDIPLLGTITPEGRASFKLKRASLEKQGMVEVVAQFYFADDVRISTPTLIFNVLRDPSAGAVGDEGDDRTLIEIILNDAPALLEQLQTAYDELVIQKAAFAEFQTESDTAFSNAQNQRNTDFNAAQTSRNDAFLASQGQRVTDFNNAQGERASLFNQAQTARQEDYATWKDAKDTELNQLASDTENSKLAADGATVNANNAATEALEAAGEATGAVAEVTGAKQSTVKSKTFSNLDARMEELEVETYKPMQNLVEKSNFNAGIAGWSGVASTLTTSAGAMLITGSGTDLQVRAQFNLALITGRKYYLKARARVTNALSTSILLGTATASAQSLTSPIANQWYDLSGISDVTSADTSLRIRHFYADAATANGKVMEVSNFLAIDLTAHFGAGKEPSKEEMDKLLIVHYDGWFDGTANIAMKLLERSAQQLIDTFMPMKNNVSNGKSVQTIGYSNYTPSLGKVSLIKGNQYYTRRKYTKQSGTEVMGTTGSIRTINPSPVVILIGDAVSRPDSQVTTFTEESREAELYLYGAQDGGTTLFENIVLIDLTKTFGKGNEPSKEEMDRLLAKYPNSFFEGTVNLTPKLLDDLRYLTSDAYMPMENQVPNGDFSQGASSWSSNTGLSTLSVVNGKLVNTTGAGLNGSNGVTVNTIFKRLNVMSGNKYYLRYKIKPYRTHSAAVYLGASYFNTGITVTKDIENIVSVILTPSAGGVNLVLYDNGSQTIEMIEGSKVEYDDVSVIDLTAVFGVGNEPTLAQMDALLATYPNSWFDGTVNLAENKRIIPFLLKRLELKADKSPEAWLSPTLQNGATVAAGNVLRYRKNGIGQVELHGVITLGTVGLGTVIFNLPAGYRIPSSMILIPAFDGSTGDAVFFRMRSSGNFECMNNLNAGRTYHFSTLFTVIA